MLGLPSSDTATVTYTPAAGFSGSDSFTYTVSDGLTTSSPATVQITVKPKTPPLCATGPETGCRTPVTSQKASLSLRDRTPDAKDQLVWKWLAGAATAKADFGNPLATSYQLCVYDAGSHTIAQASAPPGGTCGRRPCWRESASGFKYRSNDRTPDGHPQSSVKLSLREGAAGKAKIVLQGRGVHLGLDPLPATQPVTVQLKNGDVCWEAIYGAPARKNEPGGFKDKGD
jgi:hypothetical protein